MNQARSRLPVDPVGMARPRANACLPPEVHRADHVTRRVSPEYPELEICIRLYRYGRDHAPRQLRQGGCG